MILVVGHTAKDHINKVPHFPGENSSIYIEDYQELKGGGAANVASAIAKLGGDPALLSPVGKEFMSSDYEDYLKKIGVDTSELVYSDKKTANAFIYTDKEDNQMTFFYWGASKEFSDMRPPSNLNKYELIHLAPSDPEYNLRITEKAKKVSFDPGQDLPVYSKEQLRKVIENSNYLFCNQYELDKIKNKTNWGKKELINRVDVLVVTQHENGSIIFSGEKEIKIPAVEADSSDPTGAGDAYRAGFLKTHLENKSLEKAGKVASTVASFVVEQNGCQTNLPNEKQVKNRFNEFFEENY